jgi:hypothetical protein
MTDAVMFDPEGKNILPAQILYKEYPRFARQFPSCDEGQYGHVREIAQDVPRRKQSRKKIRLWFLRSRCLTCALKAKSMKGIS